MISDKDAAKEESKKRYHIDSNAIPWQSGFLAGCAHKEAQMAGDIADLLKVLESKRKNIREIDVALHGEEGAAKQVSACDLIGPARKLREERDAYRDALAKLCGAAADCYVNDEEEKEEALESMNEDIQRARTVLAKWPERNIK